MVCSKNVFVIILCSGVNKITVAIFGTNSLFRMEYSCVKFV
jgi:hypothetical protein